MKNANESYSEEIRRIDPVSFAKLFGCFVSVIAIILVVCIIILNNIILAENMVFIPLDYVCILNFFKPDIMIWLCLIIPASFPSGFLIAVMFNVIARKTKGLLILVEKRSK